MPFSFIHFGGPFRFFFDKIRLLLTSFLWLYVGFSCLVSPILGSTGSSRFYHTGFFYPVSSLEFYPSLSVTLSTNNDRMAMSLETHFSICGFGSKLFQSEWAVHLVDLPTTCPVVGCSCTCELLLFLLSDGLRTICQLRFFHQWIGE